MSIAPTVPGIQSLTLVATQEIHVRATLEDIFAALLEQIGPDNDTPEGKAMPMKIEPWPGGRCIAIWATETTSLGTRAGHAIHPPPHTTRKRHARSGSAHTSTSFRHVSPQFQADSALAVI